MAVATHTVALATALLLTPAVVVRYGRNPTWQSLLAGLVAGLVAAMLLPALTVVLCYEGNNSLLPMYLATTSGYTDSPTGRLRSIHAMNKARASDGRPQLPIPHIRPTAHTWLTGLYSVDPPVGGAPR